ncbi:MAG: hypothetical protein AAF533_28885 [Acidobacteriota bacterium]
MSDANLQDQLSRHYAQRVAESGAVDRLRASLEAEAARTPPRSRRRHWLALAAAAAAVLLTLVVLPRLRSPDVVGEIAYNHRKDSTITFVTSSIAELQASLPELDFELQALNGPAASLSLVGGRYCSIDGAIAAQLRLEDGAGRHYTCYQTRRKPRLEDQTDQDTRVDGVRVRTWSSQDLFFGLAEWSDTFPPPATEDREVP